MFLCSSGSPLPGPGLAMRRRSQNPKGYGGLPMVAKGQKVACRWTGRSKILHLGVVNASGEGGAGAANDFEVFIGS